MTFFGYDELGRLESVTDAMGRQIARILPDGATEKFTYDLVGNRTSRTDFKGVSTFYQYDSSNRLTRRQYPGGSQVDFTFTSAGKRKSAVDDRGTTRYEYDPRDRLSALIYPDGRKLGFTYDRKGNRTSLIASVGATILTTSFTYDDLNRLSTVTDPEGGVASHHYDANGNRESLQQSNGVVTAYDYDPVNRLEDIVAIDAAGAPITSFHYTLGRTGNREEIAELDGTIKSYLYDDLYRLTNEKVTLGGAPRWSNDFGYDPVGNRLTQNRVEVGGIPRNVVYGYDQRDRPATEDTVRYGWNTDGNLVSKSGPEGATYEWDFENRLKRAVLANGRRSITLTTSMGPG